jgi:hypothetical protein
MSQDISLPVFFHEICGFSFNVTYNSLRFYGSRRLAECVNIFVCTEQSHFLLIYSHSWVWTDFSSTGDGKRSRFSQFSEKNLTPHNTQPFRECCKLSANFREETNVEMTKTHRFLKKTEVLNIGSQTL